MKKILLITYLLGVVACLGYSQSLSLSDASGPLANNATVNVTGLPTDDEIVAEVNISNNTSDSIPVKCKKVEISMVPGTVSLFCWGLCFAPTVFVSPDPLYIHANATDTDNFSGHYLPSGMSGMSTIRYVFFDERNPNDSVCFNVNFQAYPLGISGLSGSASVTAYPNPASGKVTVNYSAAEGANCAVVVLNLLGTIVKEIAVESASGKVTFDAADLSAGVYFYSVVVNGNAVATKKLVVRH
jgi:hypothetical protein